MLLFLDFPTSGYIFWVCYGRESVESANLEIWERSCSKGLWPSFFITVMFYLRSEVVMVNQNSREQPIRYLAFLLCWFHSANYHLWRVWGHTSCPHLCSLALPKPFWSWSPTSTQPPPPTFIFLISYWSRVGGRAHHHLNTNTGFHLQEVRSNAHVKYYSGPQWNAL